MKYFGTENASDKSAITQDERAGRCYELSGYALALGTAPQDAILVHGSIEGFGQPRMGHAWLQLSESEIWEPMQAKIWPILAWHAIMSPEVDFAYNQSEVRKMITVWHIWGPWES